MVGREVGDLVECKKAEKGNTWVLGQVEGGTDVEWEDWVASESRVLWAGKGGCRGGGGTCIYFLVNGGIWLQDGRRGGK